MLPLTRCLPLRCSIVRVVQLLPRGLVISLPLLGKHEAKIDNKVELRSITMDCSFAFTQVILESLHQKKGSEVTWCSRLWSSDFGVSARLVPHSHPYA